MKRSPIRKRRPGTRRGEAVKIVGGREICTQSPAGRAEYQRRRELRWDIDRGICCLCGQFVPLDQATTEHPNGRGMGGSKRDDSIEAIRVAHWAGNNAKGSISYARYMELPLEKRIAYCRGYEAAYTTGAVATAERMP